MNRIPVESSNIASLGYDPSAHTLEVEFTQGRVYQYSDFPENMWNEFISAKSYGKFYAAHVKNQYPSQRIV